MKNGKPETGNAKPENGGDRFQISRFLFPVFHLTADRKVDRFVNCLGA
jgi:hypothetical protein